MGQFTINWELDDTKMISSNHLLTLPFLLLGYVNVIFGQLNPSEIVPCGGTKEITPGTRAVIQSPNFPNNYRNNQRCQYVVNCDPKESNYLEMTCPVFDLQNSGGCSKDRLIVAAWEEDPQTYCGSSTSPNGKVTNQGWTRFTFRSDSSQVRKGFRCFVWCRARTTTAPTTTPTTAATTKPTTAPTTKLTTAPPTTTP